MPYWPGEDDKKERRREQYRERKRQAVEFSKELASKIFQKTKEAAEKAREGIDSAKEKSISIGGIKKKRLDEDVYEIEYPTPTGQLQKALIARRAESLQRYFEKKLEEEHSTDSKPTVVQIQWMRQVENGIPRNTAILQLPGDTVQEGTVLGKAKQIFPEDVKNTPLKGLFGGERDSPWYIMIR